MKSVQPSLVVRGGRGEPYREMRPRDFSPFAMHPTHTTTSAKNNDNSSFSIPYSFCFLKGTVFLNRSVQIEVREIGNRK